MWLLDELDKLSKSEAIAIQYREESITYRELWERSEAVACFLEEKAWNQRPLVIYGNKEIDIIVAMHAALKVGIPYVPVDTAYPIQRLEKIVKQVNANIIIDFSNETLAGYNTLNQTDISKICKMYSQGKSDKKHWVQGDSICYILFTSGSTGEPKGVLISKNNLVNFSTWFSSYCKGEYNKGFVLNQAAYSFDLSVIDLYVFLPLGVPLFNVDRAMSSELKLLFAYLAKNPLQAWVSTPSFLSFCNFDHTFSKKLLPKLKSIILDGEILTKDLACSILDKFPDINLVNAYGPTEATVAISACVIDYNMINQKDTLPVGKVLDDGKVKLNIGHSGELSESVGELVIFSKSVGQGYWHNDKLTKEKFLQEDNMRGYCTGDLIYEKNNLLYYVGRQDFQIKLHGFRIELNDIEENLNRLEYISNSVVLPIKKDDIIVYLTAFVVPKLCINESPLKFSIRVKNDLKKLIPEYMVVNCKCKLNTNIIKKHYQ